MTTAPVEVLLMEGEREQAVDQEALGAFIAGDDGPNENGVDGSDEDDCYESVCAICDNGGRVLLCDGKCMRSFHPTVEDGNYSGCASLGLSHAEYQALEDVAFYCENCKYKKHQCFACGELGPSDESSSPEVFRCLNGACGYFYHPHCVAKLLHPGNSAAAEELKQRIASGEQFTCPAHKCHDCKEVEVRSIKELQFAVCRRCPRAYHRKCLPREITSADDVNMERGILQRAWEDLIPNRLLIYCLDHEIEPDTLMPVRDHIKFPGGKYCSSEKGDRSKKRAGKFSLQASSKRQKVASDGNSLGKLKQTKMPARDISLGDELYTTFFGTDSKLLESSSRGVVHGKNEMIQMVKPTAKRIENSVILDAATRRRIRVLMKDASSSLTLSQIKERHASPSTYVQSIFSVENITLGKVEGSVQALRAALKILDEGGCVQDAKAVCADALLLQVLRWKGKLKVYLAPFLYGMRYTSFGRHFTKMDKLKKIVDILHWHVQDGDMLVDFCCGSNDFSCLMKQKLDEMGKSCLFKNYDIVQPKNDFNFERRDWMTVKPDELPDGSQLIMGLNPPFGVKATLANKFINKALEFKPKLLILIVPRETQRLDEKESPYDLIWEDDRMLVGKSFYLPGSVDVNDKQIEDWNVNAPILSLWSNPNWTPTHRSIAEQHTHPSKNYSLDESHTAIYVPNSDRDKAFAKQGLDVHADAPENLEEMNHSELTLIHQEGLPLGVDGSEGGTITKNAPVKNHSELKSKDFGRKGKMNRRSLEDKPSINQSVLPNVAYNLESYPPNHFETTSQVHSQRPDFQQQFNQPNSSMHHLYSHITYGNQGMEDLVRKYSLKSEENYQPTPDFGSGGMEDLVRKYSLNSEVTYQPTPDFGSGAPPDQWMRDGAYNYAHRSYIGEINEDHHHRDATFQSHINAHAYPPYPLPGFPSAYGQLNTSATSEMAFVQNTSAIYQHRAPQPAFQCPLGFVPHPYGYSYSQQNSAGWLDE